MTRRRIRSITKVAFDPRLGAAGRYVNLTTGRMIPQSVVNQALELQIKDAQTAIGVISRRLAEDKISLAQWQTAMAKEVKIVCTHAAALAKGGWANMSQADWGAVGRLTRDEYKRLQDFAVSIANGKVKLLRLDGEVNGQFLRQADQFAQSGVGTFNDMSRREASAGGATHEQRVLDTAAQHCDCCIGEAGHWELIGTLKKIGNCDCHNNCRCHFIFGREVDGEIVEIK